MKRGLYLKLVKIAFKGIEFFSIIPKKGTYNPNYMFLF